MIPGQELGKDLGQEIGDCRSVRVDSHVAPQSFPILLQIRAQAVSWMDRHLRGIDNGIDREGKALIYVQGPNQWRMESQWPIPDTQRVKLYLLADRSGSIGSINDGSLLPTPPSPLPGPATVGYSAQSGPFLPTLLGALQG